MRAVYEHTITPRLTVVTTPIDTGARLIDLAEPTQPLLWQRRSDGMVGIGEAIRLEFRGERRFDDAAAAWRELCGAARIEDQVGVPGSGLIAFGAFAFAAQSELTSVLIVPSMVVGRRAGTRWLTTVTVGAEAAPSAELLKTEPTGIDPELVFESGSLTREGYLAAVENARRRISLGPLQKVVVARDLRGRLPLGADLRAPLSQLALGYPDCWTFAVDGLIGSSPETLVRIDRGEVSARVLAGSMARGADAESDGQAALALATSSKDQDEHRFALMSVMAALAPYSSDLAASDLPFALKLPNLWHLASDVHGDLDGHAGALDLIGALHPTAAVAGFPTALALATIAELEPFDRGRYAGPVGWVGADGDGEWAVALRCAQLERGGTLTAYAGAGIVADSRADRELAETTLKFRPITEAFGLSP